MTIPDKSEPSVLDYLKGKIFPGRNPVVEIPDVLHDREIEPIAEEQISNARKKRWTITFFWQLVMVLVMLLIGQQLLEPPSPSPVFSLIFYGCAIFLIIFNWIYGRLDADLYCFEENDPHEFVVHSSLLYATIGTGILATILFSGNRFTSFNLLVWFVSLLLLVSTFLEFPDWNRVTRWVSGLYINFCKNGIHFKITPWHILFGLVLLLVTFYRFYRLQDVPGEMISDHAEKLLDVYDLLSGMLLTYFVRNTGREAFQMYLSAAVAHFVGTGITFMTLKIGTAIVGLFSAIYMYFLGKEVGNRRMGMLAFFLSGIGYWPNVISRIGLRFTLYPAFTAAALFYFFRGIRRKKIPDMVLSGICVGIGLHGYSPYRIVPILLVLGMVLYVVHNWKRNNIRFAVTALVVTGIAALVIFIPLLRYVMDQPEMFLFRGMTRVGTIEQPLPGPAWQIFFSNLWRAMIMPFWNNGSIWAHSVPFRPSLDIVSAAMFLTGIVFSVLRYIRHRDWRIPFLLISVPFLMLPSILSLAFPAENPCLNRSAGALVPIFIIAAFGMDSFLHNLYKQATGLGGRVMVAVLIGMLFLLSLWQNYDLVFDEYANNYEKSAWNTSEIGEVAYNFISVYGDPDSVYVVGFPHWVDTRLVAIISGHPEKDFAIWPDQFNDTLSNKRAKLFMLRPDDTAAIDQLRKMYPDYFETMFTSQISSHDFVIFMVPPTLKSIVEAENPVP